MSFIFQSILISNPPLEDLPRRAQSSFWTQYHSNIVNTVLSLISGIILAIIAPAIFRKITAFTNWAARRIGPERNMSRQYCTNLSFEISQIKLLGMTSPRDLEEVFVPLRIRDPDASMMADRRTRLYPSLTAALSNHSRITMLGDPGAGKTTVARHVALLAAEGKIKSNGKTLMPFYIPLNEMKQRFEPVRGQNQMAPEKILAIVMGAYGFNGAQNFITRRLRAGRCLVIFDGFDELANDTRQSMAAGVIRRLARNYSTSNRIIVTSREAGFRSSQFNTFATLIIEDLPPEQVHSYVMKWFTKESLRGKDLIRILEENVRLRSLATNPLMLAVICITYEARGDLPNRRADLYEYCIDTLNTLWDESRGIDRAPAFSGPMKLVVLKHVAFELHTERKVEFTKREFSAKVRRHLPDAEAKFYQEDDFVKEVIEHTGIVRGNGAEMLAFQHLTFQEYLTARKLVDDGTPGLDYLANVASDPWWSETIVLTAGIMRDATNLIDRIYQKSLPELADDMCLLLGRCITDADLTDLTDLELKDEVLQGIVMLAAREDREMARKRKHREDGDRTASRVVSVAFQESAAQLVAEFGRENIATYLENRIGQVTDSGKRIDLIDTYAVLEKERSRISLTELAVRTSEPSEIRAACLYWLGKTGGTLAVGTVIPALTDRDPIIRTAALRSVSCLPRMDVIHLLARALKSDSSDMQAVAASTLLEIEASEVFELIDKYFHDHPTSPDAKRAREFTDKIRYERSGQSTWWDPQVGGQLYGEE